MKMNDFDVLKILSNKKIKKSHMYTNNIDHSRHICARIKSESEMFRNGSELLLIMTKECEKSFRSALKYVYSHISQMTPTNVTEES